MNEQTNKGVVRNPTADEAAAAAEAIGQAPANAPGTERPSKVALTRKVKRGLRMINHLFIEAADDSKPPLGQQIKKLNKGETRDFDAGLAWLHYIQQDQDWFEAGKAAKKGGA